MDKKMSVKEFIELIEKQNGRMYNLDVLTKEQKQIAKENGLVYALFVAHQKGIKTWVSAEPVLNTCEVISFIECADYVNLWKIGKLNYYPSITDWKSFGESVECILIAKKRYNPNFDYYIKDSLRSEMKKTK